MLLNLRDYEAAALAALPRAVAGYFASGAGDDHTLRANEAAFTSWLLRPRVLVDVERVEAGGSLLGGATRARFGVAPMAFQRMAHDSGEAAVARACVDAGVPMCLSTMATMSMEEVGAVWAAAAAPAAAAPPPLWFQLYAFRDRAVTQRLVARAERSGYAALVLTVDRPVLGLREANERNGFELPPHLGVPNLEDGGHGPPSPGGAGAGAGAGAGQSAIAGSAYHSAEMSAARTWEDVRWLARATRLPLVLKGLMEPADAAAAVLAGAAAVWVSNHGGRQLDGAPAALDALPGVVAAVRAAAAAAAGVAARGEGRRVEVYVDGGVRRGVDVVRALALGADFVWVGRPVIWGLAVGGQAGVAGVLAALAREVAHTLALLGVRSAAAVGAGCVVHRDALARRLAADADARAAAAEEAAAAAADAGGVEGVKAPGTDSE